uniref:beta-N-acetylhexosaminidase n=1 Tax=Strigamia maritima TaxID=126957 RepID=T1IUC0_STRMM
GFKKTEGAVWPQPQSQDSTDDFLVVLPSKFEFNSMGKTCDILQSAFKRYFIMIFNPPRLLENYKWNSAKKHLVRSVDELKINTEDLPGEALLYAQSIWGILRGLETFSQLVYHTPDGLFVVNSTRIRDFPRFSFRGLLLDTGRHYLPKSTILETLEAMAQNKFNVFHWHIVDDQSFPYVSRVFPQMSGKGAYDAYTHTYNLDDIIDIVMFARHRGIRVIPEFDTPGHTQSWGWGIPGLLTPCYIKKSGNMVQDGYGPIDPTAETTYKFLNTFFSEVSNSFPEKFIHLGGDEVDFDCWKSNPDILDFMQRKGFGDDFTKLEQYYMQQLLDILKSFPRNNSYIVWQEVIDNGVTVKPDTVVQVWKEPFAEELANITNKGYRALLSACWYLNYITYGSDWETFYLCDPHDFNGTEEQKKLVFGGEAAMWGEFVDATNLTPQLWPRASAVAERLWSDQSVVDTDSAAPRLEEHRCRMLIRGIDAQPVNGPVKDGNLIDYNSIAVMLTWIRKSIVLIIFLIFVGFCNAEKWKPVVKTTGSVWPQPQSQMTTDEVFIILPRLIYFVISDKSESCDLLTSAFKRYYKTIFDPPRLRKMKGNYTKKITGLLTELEVHLSEPCDNAYPTANMDEKYDLKIVPNGKLGRGFLSAKSIWGIIRGLETFGQLVVPTSNGRFTINGTIITDYPRFSYRGIMIDTGRHYLPKKLILETLEVMAQNKFNVLHWHIVDDQAFPFVSNSFPAMSEKGAYNQHTLIYTKVDITDINKAARERGIRVIPEFDTPGHTQSWGLGIPGLLTQCYKNESGKLVENGFGPIDPTVENTYSFLTKFFTEVSQSFPDQFIHLGGDEVSFDCWKSNPKVQDFMRKQKFGDNYTKLEEYYMQRVIDIINSLPGNKSYIIWQEVIDNGAKVKADTVVEVWKEPHKDELAHVTNKGYRTLLSACWYLNYITYGSDWENFYLCEPHNFNGTDAQKKLVFGGEACIWGEYVDSTNFTPRLWPRASAVAERLWSDQSVNDKEKARPRLSEHRCRMLIRGINAEPVNGPGFCPVDYKFEFLEKEVMAQNKFNVLHWHIVDDQAFPFVSNSFPAMSEKGAYNQHTHIYTKVDITDINKAAVLSPSSTPLDTPSLGTGNLVPNGFGAIDPTMESTYTFLKKIFTEISQSFSDEFIHLGSDRVSYDCWKSNPKVQFFMKQ